MSFIFLIWTILQGSHVLSILPYDVTKGDYMADEEEFSTEEISPSKSQFLGYNEGAQYLGLLFAGKSEFSWIVDVRAKTLYNEPQKMSTGNIISAKHVLTTGRAARFLQEGTASVTYCQLYLWEHLNFIRYVPAFDREEKVVSVHWRWGGTRNVRGYVMHPECSKSQNLKTLSYDIAVIRLATPIEVAQPFIGYMPIAKDPSDPNRFLNINFFETMEERKICLVGSIGRPYINWKHHMVEDYKVRYRVYIESWETCKTMMDKLCNSNDHDCRAMMSKDAEKGRDWACMRTRAKVGTVCDHDRGAPVVCEGEVVGMVVFGALLNYCNNRFPMPFVVARLYQYQDFILEHILPRSRYEGIGLSISYP